MRRLNPIKAWFISLVGIYGVVSAATPGTFRFLDRVDLVFHEAGHVIFGLFGEFIGILGGSLTQVLIPAGIVVYFVVHRQEYSAAVTLFWVAQSLFDVSVYAKDARTRRLPLFGGEDPLHDWNYLLGRLNLLNWDQAVGNLIYLVGVVALECPYWGDSIIPGRRCPRENRSTPHALIPRKKPLSFSIGQKYNSPIYLLGFPFQVERNDSDSGSTRGARGLLRKLRGNRRQMLGLI